MVYLFNEAIILHKCNIKSATHFAILYGAKVRYIVMLGKGGKSHFSKNIATYSGKLGLFMKLLSIVPFKMLQLLKLGYFVTVEITKMLSTKLDSLCGQIFDRKDYFYNIIVGTYVVKQKIVFQFFNDSKTVYAKVGNKNSQKEMLVEMNFLINQMEYKSFDLPTYIDGVKLTDDFPYNIQITDGFYGAKVVPVLTDELYNIFTEISNSSIVERNNGELLFLSHGDFVPWNIKKNGYRYTIFDWEYCDYRFYGYDLIHYLFQINVFLKGLSENDAINNAIQDAKCLDGELFKMDSSMLSEHYLKEMKRTFEK